MKAKTIKNLIFIAIIIIIIIFLFVKMKVTSVDDFYNLKEDKKQIGVVEFGIYTKQIMNKTEKSKYKSGVLYENLSFPIYEEESCYDMLVRLAKSKNIILDADYEDIYDAVYVKGIDDLYEFDYGDSSGWVYSVNNTQISIGCSQTYPKDGDKIRWHYSLDFGRDIIEW